MRLSVHVLKCEQISLGRATAVTHPLSKFWDEVTTGITFDRGIGFRTKLPFFFLTSLQNKAKSYRDSVANLTVCQPGLIKEL